MQVAPDTGPFPETVKAWLKVHLGQMGFLAFSVALLVSVYAAEIRTQALDFREDVQAELIPLELPESLQQQCREIAKALMLEWTAIIGERRQRVNTCS
jgi:hypothetical protein